MANKSLAFFGLVRFCNDCNQQKDDTIWVSRYRERLCVDCYNMLCEAEEADYANEEF